jgi:phi13 family phage major tail protein
MGRVVGLRDIYFAKQLTDTDAGATYSAPVEIARAINAKISPKTSSEKWYSNDSVEEVIEGFDSIDVEVEVNDLTLASRALLQGLTTSNGELVETNNDIAPVGALLFRSKTSTGKYRYVVLYKGKFSLTEDEYASQADKVESKTPKLKGTFYAREDGKWRFILDENETGASTTKIGAWFTAVQEPGTGA